MQTSIRQQQARAKQIAQLQSLTQSGSRCAALSLAASMRRSNWVKPNFGRSLQTVHLFGYPSEDTAAIKGLVSETTHHRPPLRT